MLKHLNSDEVAQIALDKNSVAALEPTAALHRCPRCAAESVTAGIQQVAFLAERKENKIEKAAKTKWQECLVSTLP